MDVMKSAAEREAIGEGVMHMEVGQPSTAAPGGVIAAAKQALDDDVLGYTLAMGIPPCESVSPAITRIATVFTCLPKASVSPRVLPPHSY